jgi:hypothetical protein
MGAEWGMRDAGPERSHERQNNASQQQVLLGPLDISGYLSIWEVEGLFECDLNHPKLEQTFKKGDFSYQSLLNACGCPYVQRKWVLLFGEVKQDKYYHHHTHMA